MDKEQEEAFTLAKQAFQMDFLLAHFDPEKPLIMLYDASQHGT